MKGSVSPDVKDDTDEAGDAAALTSRLLILEKKSSAFLLILVCNFFFFLNQNLNIRQLNSRNRILKVREITPVNVGSLLISHTLFGFFFLM